MQTPQGKRSGYCTKVQYSTFFPTMREAVGRMGGTWEEMGGNGRSNSRSTRGEIAVFSSKTPILSIMDMNVIRNLHKTYIFVSFLPDSPPFPPVLSRILPYLPRPFLAPPGPFPEPPGDPAGTSGSIRGGHAIHILHMGAPGRNREEPGRIREGPVVYK